MGFQDEQLKGAPSLKSGTTVAGLRTNDFVIVASDRQSTMGHAAFDLECRKTHKITDNIVIALAGQLGDASHIIRVLKMQSSTYEAERTKKMSVKALTTLTSNILNANRMYPFLTFFIVGGFLDKPELYTLDLVGGMSEERRYITGGSGSDFAMGVFDNSYKENLTKKEALDLVVDAIRASKKRDIHTGGEKIDLFYVDKNGIEHIEKS